MTRDHAVGMTEYRFTALFEPDEDGGYTVSFPALPGCLTHGATKDEARRMAAEALEGYLETLQEDGMPIPVEHEVELPICEPVSVQLKAV